MRAGTAKGSDGKLSDPFMVYLLVLGMRWRPG